MSITDIKEMSIIERIHAMELLWDSLCEDDQNIYPPEWHESVLNARKEKMDSSGAEFLTLDQAKPLHKNWQ